MDTKAFLKELGMTDADVDTMSADPKMKTAIEAAVKRYDEGVAARVEAETKLAQATRQASELNDWWKKEAQPALLNSDSGAASAKAEVARLKTYMKSMKDQGYPVEDQWLSDSPVTPAQVTPVTPKTPAFDAQAAAYDMARATAMLYDLGEEHRTLYGEPLPGAASLLEEAHQQNRPLTDYVRTKFNFDGKRKELGEKREAERVERITKDITEKLEAKYAERSNPNLAPAVVSKAAEVAERNKEHADSWKTKQGRAEAKRDRLVEFRNVASRTA